MFSNKKIAWKSWNARVDSLQDSENDLDILEEILASQMENTEEFRLFEPKPKVVHTPYGVYTLDSFLKPSDRWDCWICYTNFDITHGVKHTLERIDGVEAVKVLGRYTFFLGIGKMFDVHSVRMDIQTLICGNVEEETIAPELKAVVQEIKDQVKSSAYWSIFVSPVGEIDYAISDVLDNEYLDSIRKFEKRRNETGGIILRSGND